MPNRRVTLRDIAVAAGVHYSTISLALRNHPRLPRATCLRVQRLARKMGYVPDPMLASLANYRSGLRPVGYQATLAWVTAFPGRNDWREVDIFREQHAGAENGRRSWDTGWSILAGGARTDGEARLADSALAKHPRPDHCTAAPCGRAAGAGMGPVFRRVHRLFSG